MAEGVWTKISNLEHYTIESGTSKVTEMVYFTKIRINFTEASSDYGYITIKSKDTYPWVEVCPFYYKECGDISTVMVNTPYNYYIQEDSETRTSKSKLFTKGTKVDGMVKEFDMNTLAETEDEQFYVSSWQKNVVSDNIEIYVEAPTPEPCITASGTCGAEGDNVVWELSCDGVLTISGTGAMEDYPSSTTKPWAEFRTIIKELVVKEGVTSIGDRSFSAGTAHLNEGYKIESLTLPNSLTRIGQFAFFDCTTLASLQIPENVESIGYAAFYDCNLTSVFIPASVTNIEKSAFEDNTFLASMEVENGNLVYDSREDCNAIIETASNTLISGCQNSVIPVGIVAIGDAAFRQCSRLTAITFPEGIKTIGPNAFDECSGLTSIELPEGVTTIGEIAFHSCLNVTSVILPNSLTRIGASAFANCKKLTSITIPSKVTVLGNLCFAVGKSLTTVNFEPITPPAIGEGCFDNSSCLYYVPCGTKNAYVTALGVYSGRIIEQEPFDYSYSVTSADNTNGAVTITYESATCYNFTISFRADAAKGYRFKQWSDGNADNPRTIELTQDTMIIAFFAPIPSDIVLLENEDANYYNQFAEDYNGYAVNTATLNRQFAQGKWATLCLPFDVRKAQMISLGLYGRVFEFRYAEVTESNTLVAHFAVAQSVEAGKGYIVNANAKLAQKTSFVFPGVTVNTDADNGDITTLTGYNDNSGRGNLWLVGTLRTGTLYNYAGGNTYLGLKDNMIYYPNTTTGTAVRAYRGFFRSGIGGVIEEGDDDDEPAAPQRVRIVVEGETVTELEVMNGEAVMQDIQPASKFIDNGILYIERNGKTYTAQGAEL